MLGVAVPATRCLHVPQRGHLRVKSVVISGEALSVTIAARGRRSYLPGSRANIGNLVRGVTIRTNRGLSVSCSHCLPMDTSKVLRYGTGMTGAAGRRNVGPVRAAVGICVTQNLVCSMTTRACGRHEETVFGQCKPVDGVHIHRVNVGQIEALRNFRIPMAGTASPRNIQGIYRRSWILDGNDAVRIAVAPNARLRADFRVNAGVHVFRFAAMTDPAANRRRVLRMGILLDVRVAVVAGETSVNAGLPLVFIHIYAVSSLILERLVAMAGQTVGGLRRRQAKPEK